LSDDTQDKPDTGEIVATGEGRFENGQLTPMNLHVGDEIMFTKFGGHSFKYEGVEYLLMGQEDVLAVVRD